MFAITTGNYHADALEWLFPQFTLRPALLKDFIMLGDYLSCGMIYWYFVLQLKLVLYRHTRRANVVKGRRYNVSFIQNYADYIGFFLSKLEKILLYFYRRLDDNSIAILTKAKNDIVCKHKWKLFFLIFFVVNLTFFIFLTPMSNLHRQNFLSPYVAVHILGPLKALLFA